jgi:diguanylate cyclase (GGDEF)-like protein
MWPVLRSAFDVQVPRLRGDLGASVRVVPVRANTDVSMRVAAHLMPVRRFDQACDLVVDHLTRIAPMGLWAVTRVHGGEQTFLTARGDAYPLATGAVVPYAASFCRSMVGGAAPRIAPDVTAVPEYAAAAEACPLPVGAYVGTPIVAPDGALFGTVCGYDPQRQDEPSTQLQPLLDLLSSLLSAVLAGDLHATEAARELEQARREADTDPLTGLLNRRGWDRYLRAEEQRFRRFGDPACIVIIDLDQLKVVNDTCGHDAGDRHIRRAAEVLAETFREGDVLARLGGDEFGVVAVGVTADQGGELVGRAERAMAAAGVSGSFGLAPYTVVSGFPGAWQQADAAMYEQKRRRRGRPGRRVPVDDAAAPTS